MCKIIFGRKIRIADAALTGVNDVPADAVILKTGVARFIERVNIPQINH